MYKIDLNLASVDRLEDHVPGLSFAKAQHIVRYRELKGPFASMEDVAKVPLGLGLRTRDFIEMLGMYTEIQPTTLAGMQSRHAQHMNSMRAKRNTPKAGGAETVKCNRK